ncbi:capsule biosynthesis protein [Comamonas sp. UBA7528]|uniref:capsule biosynthesis protein n=1 Tax=Comamonas sp. UBA7528 TaxID=1946391 RepID=UPI0025BBF87B|nr:capsular biosynthesis protein [Comamonas sp. UBA7528]
MNKPSFHGKKVLFLQGPVGPFFWNLSKDMKSKGADVYKFNFNAGDWLFFRENANSFRGDLTEWPEVLGKFIKEKSIDVIILFGDCRPVHACVRGLAQELGCAVGVFEEGYLRPDYVTFEPVGVNGNSEFSQSLAPWLVQQALSKEADNKEYKINIESKSIPVGNTYWYAARWGMLYFFVSWISQWFWNNTLHHRQMSVLDAPWWCLSYGRKIWYKIKEKGVEEKLCGEFRHRFFLIPLQVHNDSQITVHSDFDSVCNFADYVMRSFSKALIDEQKELLPKDALSISDAVLVFKHHPMDRGHRNYGRALKLLTRRYGLEGKIIYIHDQHLPALLKATRGVVLVNSTVGLSALQHGAPVKVCGTALYDMPGLTFQGRLRDFWHMTGQAIPDAEELKRFKQALIRRTQLNGSFYKKMSQVEWQCGVALDGQMAERLWPAAVSAFQKPSSQFLKSPMLAPAKMSSDGVWVVRPTGGQGKVEEQDTLSVES